MSKLVSAIAAVVVASALLIPTISHAEDSNSMRVSYADLDLASFNGQHVLQRRMTGAAKIVCVIEDSKELALASATNGCRSDAVARAQPAYEAAVASAKRGSVTVLDAAALIISAQ